MIRAVARPARVDRCPIRAVDPADPDPRRRLRSAGSPIEVGDARTGFVRAVPVAIWVASGFALVGVTVFPWRWFGYRNSFDQGSHLYQVDLGAMVVIVNRWIDTVAWASPDVAASGVAIAFVALSAHQSDAASIVSNLHIEIGYAVTFMSGLVMLVARAFGAVVRVRASRGRIAIRSGRPVAFGRLPPRPRHPAVSPPSHRRLTVVLPRR